jgi:hypothetical protein
MAAEGAWFIEQRQARGARLHTGTYYVPVTLGHVRGGCMMRRLIAGLVILAFAMVSVSAALAGGGRPLLGWKRAFPNGQGFGAVKPRTVYLGGDPTGQVSKLRWNRWGSGKTVGYGQGWCPGQSVASGHYCTTSLHAYDIATCHGRRAYRMMVFYFKPRPRQHWVAGAKLNVCTGRYGF